MAGLAFYHPFTQGITAGNLEHASAIGTQDVVTNTIEPDVTQKGRVLGFAFLGPRRIGVIRNNKRMISTTMNSLTCAKGVQAWITLKIRHPNNTTTAVYFRHHAVICCQ